MRRIMITGASGSGKTTLAAALGRRLRIPVFPLDSRHFDRGWVPRDRAAFDAEVDAVAARDAWIIDGNSSSRGLLRDARADTIIWLDLPTPLRLWRVLRRTWRHYGRVRDGSAEGCAERLDVPFLLWTAGWRAPHRRKARASLQRAPGTRVVHLRSSQAVGAFLETIPTRALADEKAPAE